MIMMAKTMEYLHISWRYILQMYGLKHSTEKHLHFLIGWKDFLKSNNHSNIIMKATISYIMYTIWACMWTFLWMHYISFVFLTVVMLFDTLAWTAKSIRLGEFKSGRLTRGIIAKLFILWLVLMFWWASHTLFPSITRDDSFLWLVIGMLAIAEVISSVQNVMMIRSWEHIEERDAVSFVLSSVLWMLRSKLENMKK